MIVEAWTLNH